MARFLTEQNSQSFKNMKKDKRKYVDTNKIIKLLHDCITVFDEYEEKLESGDRGKFNECINIYRQLMKELSPENIALIPQKDREQIRRLYNIIREFWGGSVSSLLHTAYDYHEQRDDPTAVAKLQIIFNLPYFSPDEWLDKYFNVSPLILSLDSKLPKGIEDRLYEATYCYIYGFYNACIALCRSILEGAFKEKVKGNFPGGKIPDDWKLDEIIKWLGKISYIDKQSTWDIRKIKKQANEILHDLDNVDKKRCRRYIKDTRKLLEELY